MGVLDGPEPRVYSDNGIRYIDPNPTDEIINQEDLVIYVNLKARTKGRSIVTNTDASIIEIEGFNSNVAKETNFTYPTGQSELTTDWTNIGGGTLLPGEDTGGFGITNVNIEFKSSFMPKIVIDFVDIRGATLFEQGPCSPYAAFFHLPYPVFELTIKGYYGKPVKYTLALVKFNTKFNADTGNFESRGEFVGYTYAFLADIPMGYVMAATYMTKPLNGKEVLKEKWDKLKQEHPELANTTDGLPNEPLTIQDLILKSQKLEKLAPSIRSSPEVNTLNKINAIKDDFQKVIALITEYQRKFKEMGGKSKKGGDGLGNKMVTELSNLTKLNQGTEGDPGLSLIYFGDGTETSFKTSLIGTKLTLLISELQAGGVINDINLTSFIPDITIEKINNNCVNFLGGTDDRTQESYIDIGESVLVPLNIQLKSLDEFNKKIKDNVKDEINRVVKSEAGLGFNPSVRNVFAIILINVEVFLELMVVTSENAENEHKTNSENIKGSLSSTNNILNNKNKDSVIYPWPTYYEVTTGTLKGEKETYPGENINFIAWPEVIFVEDFVNALTKLRIELDIIAGDFEDMAGFDNYRPISPFETQAFGDERAPNRWFNFEQSGEQFINEIWRILGENAFLVGDYTMINSLTLWKSQLGLRDTWGYNTQTQTPAGIPNPSMGGPPRFKDLDLGISNGKITNRYKYTEQEGWGKRGARGKITTTNKERMKQWGYVDGLNFINICKDDVILTYVKNLTNTEGGGITDEDVDSITESIISYMSKNSDFTEQTFDEWRNTASAEINNGVANSDFIPDPAVEPEYWKNASQGEDGGEGMYKDNPDPLPDSAGNSVLTLKGPIKLNENLEVSETYISANPHRNAMSGVRLLEPTSSELDGRNIDLNIDTIPGGQAMISAYEENYSDTTESDTDSEETKTGAVKGNLCRILLDGRGKGELGSVQKRKEPIAYHSEIKKTSFTSPYDVQISCSSNANCGFARDEYRLNADPKTGLLSYGKDYKSNFFVQAYEKGSGSDEGRAFWHLGSSRTVWYNAPTTIGNGLQANAVWADFIGATAWSTDGLADLLWQTPLWTLNYPLYKRPAYTITLGFKTGGGPKNYVSLSERLNAGNKDDPQTSISTEENYSRNFDTWWGLNQYTVKRFDPNNPDAAGGQFDKTYRNYGKLKDQIKPLAYLFIMSQGLNDPNDSFGYFPPYDGISFNHIGCFSSFGSSTCMADVPKSWVLVIGAILWRAKESGNLNWYLSSNNDNIEPSKALPNGWNNANKSVGIDDLNDPVWFFHNSISKPWHWGGCVFDNWGATQTGGGIIEWNGGATRWSRKYLGQTDTGVDRWAGTEYYDPDSTSPNTPKGTDDNKWRRTNFAIGPDVDFSSLHGEDTGSVKEFTKTEPSYRGWTKSHVGGQIGSVKRSDQSLGTLPKREAEGIFVKVNSNMRGEHNINKGLFDVCRPDQIPVIYYTPGANYTNKRDSWVGQGQNDGPYRFPYRPKTLVISDISGQEKNQDIKGTTYSWPSGGNSNWVKNATYDNRYLDLKRDVKELMYLPSSIKKDFIKAFEDFANDAQSWLPVVDPLNWAASSKMLGEYEGIDGTVAAYQGIKGFLSETERNNLSWGKGTTKSTGFQLAYRLDVKPTLRTYSVGTLGKSAAKSTETNARSEAESDAITSGAVCFTYGHKVRQTFNKVKNIEDINIGDTVLSYDLEENEFLEKVVKDIKINYMDKLIKIILKNGIHITTTTQHPFFIKNKGLASYDNSGVSTEMGGTIKKLNINDILYYYNDNEFIEVEIKNIILINKQKKVFDLEIEGGSSYIVNNVYTHQGTKN